MNKVISAAVLSVLSLALAGADLYVSQARGGEKGPGTRLAPFKAIPDALRKAKPGDVIHVAQGNYAGVTGASEILIDKPVTIIGGYSIDFAVRDVMKYPTLVQPPNEKNGTKSRERGLILLKLPGGRGPDMVIDGLFIDQGYMNSYHYTRGKPEGVDTGMWLEGPAKGARDKFPSANVCSIRAPFSGRYEGNIIVRNCIIANSGNIGISISLFRGGVKIVNNVFVACRMGACEVITPNDRADAVTCEFANNTVLFTWSRLSNLADMGYGFRCGEKVASNIHHNIFGLNIFSGVGNDRGDADSKKINLDNNVFFLNRKSDVAFAKNKDADTLHLRVDTGDFEDLSDYPGMESVEGNVILKDPGAFRDVLNPDYLAAFLSTAFSEETDYEEESPVNLFRAAMGMDKADETATRVFMFCNRYPLKDVFKIFGVLKDCGAQVVK